MYLNNIMIFTQTLKEHHQAACKVIEILAKYKLFLYPKKCEFDKQWIEHLGLVILVEMDPIKIAEVWDWPTLQNHTKLQAFLGFTNFYWWFIQGFSSVA